MQNLMISMFLLIILAFSYQDQITRFCQKYPHIFNKAWLNFSVITVGSLILFLRYSESRQ